MCNIETLFLNPKVSLTKEVAAWLCEEGRIRLVEGARSLSHLLVIVPTAQSGRNLRLALAELANIRGWGGILPPTILMPQALLVDDAMPLATPAEELAAMYLALKSSAYSERTSLAFASSLLGLYNILGEDALLMREVECATDVERWQVLTKIEASFLNLLTAKGLSPRILSRRSAIAKGITLPNISEIILPAAVDLQGAFIKLLSVTNLPIKLLIHADKAERDKFDEWGRPVAYFTPRFNLTQVIAAPTAVIEADLIAQRFRAVKTTEELPALVVGDAEMSPELAGAFQNYFDPDELVLRNSAREPLTKSALGRLLISILKLAETHDYETFSTFVRQGDVARYLSETLSLKPATIAAQIGELDTVQNEHLPRTIEDVIAFASPDLIKIAELIKAEVKNPFEFLKKLFASLRLNENNPSDRELIAAAEVVRDLKTSSESEFIPSELRSAIFLELLKSSAFMLEPTANNVLSTLGWLEVAWCTEPELIIAGFNEGAVPENVVGHPFLPNSLRAELGLLTNDKRAMRDSFLFAEALRARNPDYVTIYLHQIAGDKNVMKPSRLLFLGVSDVDLPDFAKRLYAVVNGNSGAPPKALPSAWPLALPIPPTDFSPRKRISVTALDGYYHCPFSFYLSELFGEHADDKTQELNPQTFGTLCHEALDEFAKCGPKDSTNPDEIASYLEKVVRLKLKVFGEHLPAIIELQGEAAIARLKSFANLQALRRAAGWRIVASEQSLACTIKGLPTLIRGKVDRIDEHETTHDLAIIDYKTWSRATDDKRDSLQLPIYRAMVEAAKQYDPIKAHSSIAFYCVLAAAPEDVIFDEAHAATAGHQSEAEDKVVAALNGIAQGIFYPSKNDDWKKRYSELLGGDLAISEAWLNDQARRRGGEA